MTTILESFHFEKKTRIILSANTPLTMKETIELRADIRPGERVWTIDFLSKKTTVYFSQIRINCLLTFLIIYWRLCGEPSNGKIERHY